MTALLASAGAAMGQNSLTVADVTLPQNSDVSLTVSYQFDGADTYTGYSFNLELPSELEFVMAEGTDVAFTKGICHDASHSVTANLDEGLVKVAGRSLSSKPLSGISGTLLTFTIKPKSAVTVGQTFTGTIKDILIVPVEGSKQNLANSTFTVTIGEPVELRTILDEASTTAPEAATGVDVRVKRTINANEWSTLVLPFAMTDAQVKDAFGDDVELMEFMDYEINDEATSITVNFDAARLSEDGLMANNPYIIKTSKDITEFTVDDVTIDPDEEGALAEYTNGKSGSRKVVYGTFKGTYHAQTSVPQNSLFLSGNLFWYSTGLTKMKAFRAYFDFVDVLSEVDDSASRITLSFGDNNMTGISASLNDKEEMINENCYDLQGRRVESSIFNSQSSILRKGMYIREGKVIVVK